MRAPDRTVDARRTAPGAPRTTDNANDAWRWDQVERTLLWLRIAVVAGAGALMVLGSPTIVTYRSVGVATMSVAGVYAVVLLWADRFVPLILSSAADLVLATVGAAATGACRSPLTGIVLLVVASAALRFDRARALQMAGAAALAMALMGMLTPQPSLPGIVRSELTAALVVMALMTGVLVGVMARLEAHQRHAATVAALKAGDAERADFERRRLLRALLHDVNTPLAGARLVSRTWTAAVSGSGGPGLEAARLMQQNLTYLQMLFEDMRSVVGAYDPNHVTPLLAAPTDLRTLVDDAVHIAESLVSGMSQGVSVSLAPGLPAVVRVDEAKVKRLLTNLVANAVEHAGPYAPVEVGVTHDGGTVTLAVSDRGPRIPQAFLGDDLGLSGPANGFDRLRGVGLWVVRQLATVLGGELRFDPREGGGNVARVRLPAPPVHLSQPEADDRSVPVHST